MHNEISGKMKKYSFYEKYLCLFMLIWIFNKYKHKIKLLLYKSYRKNWREYLVYLKIENGEK